MPGTRWSTTANEGFIHWSQQFDAQKVVVRSAWPTERLPVVEDDVARAAATAANASAAAASATAAAAVAISRSASQLDQQRMKFASLAMEPKLEPKPEPKPAGSSAAAVKALQTTAARLAAAERDRDLLKHELVAMRVESECVRSRLEAQLQQVRAELTAAIAREVMRAAREAQEEAAAEAEAEEQAEAPAAGAEDPLLKSVAFFLNRELAKGWNGWRVWYAAFVEARDKMRQSLGRLINRKLSLGWQAREASMPFHCPSTGLP